MTRSLLVEPDLQKTCNGMKIYIVEGSLTGFLVRYVVIAIDEEEARSLISKDCPIAIIDTVKLIGNALYYDETPAIVCLEEP